MYWLASIILCGVYLLLPAVSLAAFFVKSPYRIKRHVAGGWISGTLLGGAILGAYVFSIGGHVPPSQIATTLYLGVSLLLLLKLVDHLLLQGLQKALRVTKGAKRWRLATALLLRVVIFGSLALPWVMAAVMVYRPRLEPIETPDSVLQLDYREADFRATDGTRVGGWFVPADGTSETTALLCHGLGSSKAGFFQLLKTLHEQDINVLLIDHRAHGRSGGQRCTFGANEEYDVRGAIDWLRQAHPDQSHRIVGVGASMGAAALLRAASEDDRMDGVVVLGTYESMPSLTRDIAMQQLIPPISWLTRAFGLPMASLHAGVDLSDVSPADAIGHIWPRPVLVIHGIDDEIIPFDHGRRLFDAASPPRESLWVQHGTHNGIIENPQVLKRIADFIHSARPVPVI